MLKIQIYFQWVLEILESGSLSPKSRYCVFAFFIWKINEIIGTPQSIIHIFQSLIQLVSFVEEFCNILMEIINARHIVICLFNTQLISFDNNISGSGNSKEDIKFFIHPS